MPQAYPTPQDAEDAYYDAIEAQDLETLMSVWEASDEVICLLPMLPAVQGRSSVREVWSKMFHNAQGLEIEVIHMSWIETAELAIHLVEERVRMPEQPEPHRVYASNIYRKQAGNWYLLMHQNAPTPPPPGLRMPPS
ncbi:MAG: nuclear transport factor 2 family protein [Candidatus Thiodiazotropha sp.]